MAVRADQLRPSVRPARVSRPPARRIAPRAAALRAQMVIVVGSSRHRRAAASQARTQRRGADEGDALRRQQRGCVDEERRRANEQNGQCCVEHGGCARGDGQRPLRRADQLVDAPGNRTREQIPSGGSTGRMYRGCLPIESVKNRSGTNDQSSSRQSLMPQRPPAHDGVAQRLPGQHERGTSTRAAFRQ